MTEKTQIVFTAKDETRAAIASAQRGLESLKASVAGLANTFASIGAGGGLIGLVGGAGLAATLKATVDDLDKLNDSVERLGISAEDLSALNFAGKMSGLEADDMTQALTKLSVKMQEAASGSKEAGALFADLGVKVTDSSGKLKSADQVFAEVAEAFAGMEDGAGKTALAVDTFGKSGAKLVPLLNSGADGLARMRKEGAELGAIIDGKLVKQAAEFNDNMDRLSILSSAVGRSIVSDLLPSLNKLATEFLAAQSAGLGFFDMLYARSSSLGGDNSEKVRNTRVEIERLTKARDDAMESNRRDGGSIDTSGMDSKLKSLRAQYEYFKKLQLNEALAGADGNYGNEGRGIATTDTKKPVVRTPTGEDKPKKTGGGTRADDAERLLKNLREQIAVNDADLQSVEKLSGAEKERAKTLYQLDTGTLKATASQREAILAAYGTLAANEKLLVAQEDYRKALEGAEASNLKNRQGMIEQIAAAEKAAELFGLNAAQISVVEQARLADAIAIARENGATEDMIAVMEEELRLHRQLSDALIKGETKNQEKKDAEDAIKALSEMDQFTIQAARNMQDAFADFFMNFDKGTDDMAQQFGQTLKKMIAEAASAQLLNLMFGDMGKTGKVGGLAGSALGWLSEMFTFADGGIMTGAGPVPLRKYASGGIASSPQLAMFGEGSTPEAYVPLPDGRRIPVAMQGGGGSSPIVININSSTGDPAEIRRSAAAGARAALGVMSGARRYG